MKDIFSELFPPSALDGVIPPDEISNRQQPDTDRHIWTITRLLSVIRNRIEDKVGRIWLSGEISNLSTPLSGHSYFTLKDRGVEIKAVLFRTRADCAIKPANGLKVLCLGKPDIYTARGELQFIVEQMECQGTGELSEAFARLKDKLEKEGLFDSSRKKSLPLFPETIYLITSPSGAAVQDFVKTALKNRCTAEIIIVPSVVQGDDAPEQLCDAITKVSDMAGRNDVAVFARGGGSMEDLSAFNDERLARKIAACNVPVVSAVGHETDFTITDFVADVRAETPTAAAARLFQHQAEIKQRAENLDRRLFKAIYDLLSTKSHQFERLQLRLMTPERQITEYRFRTDELSRRLASGIINYTGAKKHRLRLCELSIARYHPERYLKTLKSRLQHAQADIDRTANLVLQKNRHRLALLAGRLEAASPLTTLARGYSLVTDMQGRAIKSCKAVKLGDMLLIRPNQGSIYAQVTNIEPTD